MISDNIQEVIKSAWQTKPESVTATTFDSEMADRLNLKPKTIKNLRHRLNLVHRTTVQTKSPIPNVNSIVQKDIDKLVAEEKNKLEASAYRKELKKVIQTKIKNDLISDKFLAAVTKIKPPVMNIPASSSTTEEDMVVVISDSHVGYRVDLDYVSGLSSYDVSVFQKRADLFCKAVAKLIADRNKVTKIKKLWVFMLGDIVDGNKIHSKQPYEIEHTIIDQMLLAFQTFSSCISTWSSLVPALHVEAVCGNHGLVGYDCSSRDNWEYLLYKMMQIQLQNHTNVHFSINRSPFATVAVGNHKFLLTHGDEVRGRVPVAAAVKVEGEWRGILKHDQFDYYVFGHHHRQTSVDTNGGEIFINGAWPGGTNYSIGKLQLTGEPTQWVFGISAKEGVSWRYKVNLEKFVL